MWPQPAWSPVTDIRGGGLAENAPARACQPVTVRLPFICEWKSQVSLYWPGLLGAVKESWPFPATCWSMSVPETVTVCAAASLFVTLTVVPAFTVRLENLKPEIESALPPVAPEADPGFGEVAPPDGSDEEEPPPQPVAVIAAVRSVATRTTGRKR